MPKKKRWLTLLLGTMLPTLLGALPAFPQPNEELKAVRKEIESLKEGQAAIQKELREIKTLLRARPAAATVGLQNVVLSVEGAPFKGDKGAKLTLIDFSDYQ